MLARSTGGNAYASSAIALTPLASEALAPAGGDQPHNNLMPYLTFNFCIALQGLSPAYLGWHQLWTDVTF